MSTLVQLQRDFQSHVLDSDAAIAAAIDSSEQIPAATRLGIYFDAYRLRLIEALQANFPILQQLLGADAFARLTQLYLTIHPSRHYSIRWFGHRLNEFLSEFAEYRAQPWLAELAAWEWRVAAAFDAEDSELLAAGDLANISPDEWSTLQFALHPSVQRLSLTTNAATIAKAANDEQPLPIPTQHGDPVEWLIWRQDLTVRYRSLDAAEAAALETIANGATFGELCEALAEHIAADAVPLRAATLLQGWIVEQLLIAKR